MRRWKISILMFVTWYVTPVYDWSYPSSLNLQESQAITTSETTLTNELHIIRAHQLHYSSLLADFRKTIIFIRDTKNPALDSLSPEEIAFSRRLMDRECANLLTEIERLEMGRKMQDRRLKNVMNLVCLLSIDGYSLHMSMIYPQVFSTVNIVDSKRMQKITQVAVRDSAGKLGIPNGFDPADTFSSCGSI